MAVATWPTEAIHSSNTNKSPSSAGRAMQPLASERGPPGAAAVSASSVLAPTSRPRRAGGQSRAQTGRAAPPTAAGNPSARGRLGAGSGTDGAGSAAHGLPRSDTWSPSAPPPVTATRESLGRPKVTSPRALWLGSNVWPLPLPLRSGCLVVPGAKGYTLLHTRAGSCRKRTLAWESGNLASSLRSLSPCFQSSDS